MSFSKRSIQAFCVALPLLLSACAGAPTTVALTKPPTSLNFLDLTSFDRELSASLNVNPEKVEVSFYDPISPNQLPERIDKWMAAVESSGGKISVQRPAGEPVPKGPFVLASLIGTAFSSVKTLAAIQKETAYNSARGRDALLVLERDKTTAKLQVAKIIFVKPAP